MRKIIILLGFLAMACSGNEPEETAADYTYNATIRTACGSGISKTYEVTETTYNNLNEYLVAGGTCHLVKFQDVTKEYRAGYLAGIGKMK